MKKRGLFFSLDAFISITIIVVALFIFFAMNRVEVSTTQTAYFSQDFLDLFYETRIYEINDDDYPYIADLKSKNYITNVENTIMEQLGEFYENGQYGYAEGLVTNITVGIIPEQYDYNIFIEGRAILSGKTGYNESKQLISSQRIIFGMLDRYQMWGPLKSEVWIWQVN